jgi:hypothetical protein
LGQSVTALAFMMILGRSVTALAFMMMLGRSVTALAFMMMLGRSVTALAGTTRQSVTHLTAVALGNAVMASDNMAAYILKAAPMATM